MNMDMPGRKTSCYPLPGGKEKHLLHLQVKAVLRNDRRRPGHATTARERKHGVRGHSPACDARDSRYRVSTTLRTPGGSRQNPYRPYQEVVVAGSLGFMVAAAVLLLPESLPAAHLLMPLSRILILVGIARRSHHAILPIP